jgi:hypothetical protein
VTRAVFTLSPALTDGGSAVRQTHAVKTSNTSALINDQPSAAQRPATTLSRLLEPGASSDKRAKLAPRQQISIARSDLDAQVTLNIRLREALAQRDQRIAELENNLSKSEARNKLVFDEGVRSARNSSPPVIINLPSAALQQQSLFQYSQPVSGQISATPTPTFGFTRKEHDNFYANQRKSRKRTKQ